MSSETSGSDLVRASRDGDQFHYAWAARQSLKLLSPQSGLTAVTIEGASIVDKEGPDGLLGDELIDVGLYFGSERPADARAIHYVQLKHSTRRVNKSWTPAELEKTLAGFGARYRVRLKQLAAAFSSGRVRFQFISNRRFSKPILTSLKQLAEGTALTYADTAASLVRFTGLKGKQVQAFFSLLDFDGSAPDVWNQRNMLSEDLRGYLPEADVDGPVQLKELVTRKATTEFESNPTIRRDDILRALKTSELDLFPAPSRIPSPDGTIARKQEPDILREILGAGAPIVIHADGGVGKSVLAARLAQGMPKGSVAVLYDCYGVGLYRNALDFRHRHRDGLVQIANEMASRGWCHPLIPAGHADAKGYMRAFAYRLEQASRHIRALDPTAVICVIVDAADNAETAAREQGDPGSFVRDLIRMPIPEGVRLVFTSRSHRVVDFDPPAEAEHIELEPFNEMETGQHLRSRFSKATPKDVAEFAYLSSHNPRVQALALQGDASLSAVLKALGPEPTTVAAAIGGLLQGAVNKLKSETGGVAAEQVDRICVGLATLRPLVPIGVLAKLSDVPEGAIRSFATDLGPPLRIAGDSLHFRDEPVETWFRDTFKPPRERLIDFVETLRPQASESAYVASALPELLLDGGFHAELVDLALSGKDLPETNPLERRDVEVQRLIFALRACLRTHRYLDAVKLAVRAAGETAGEGRQISLIQNNVELASALIAPDRVEELVARRTFGSDWMGAHHAYDAAIMADHPRLSGDAASRLRMALEWLDSWARRPRGDPRERDETVDHEDRVTLAYAVLRVHGPRQAAAFLRRWTHRPVAFIAGRMLARRLIDLGHFEDVQALGIGARNNVWLLLALALELRNAGRALDAGPLKRLLRLLSFKRLKLKELDEWSDPWPVLQAVAAAIETAVLTLPAEFEAWAQILDRVVPEKLPHDLSARLGHGKPALLRAYALRAALRGGALDLLDLASDAIRKDLLASYGRSEEARIFKSETGAILPWSVLGADVVTGRVASGGLDARIVQAEKASEQARQSEYREGFSTLSDIAVERAAILCRNGMATAKRRRALRAWVAGTVHTPTIEALTRMSHLFGRTKRCASDALHYAGLARARVEAVRDEADTQGQSLLALARAIFTVSEPEARAHFDRAIEILSRIGDENIPRWECFLHLARVAEAPGVARAETAYRMSRVGELTRSLVARDKYFDWDGTIDAVAGLDPASLFTLLSRWRDRRFGDDERLLSEAVEALIKRGQLTPRDSLAFAGVPGLWNHKDQLDAFLETAPDANTREAGIAIAFRYLRMGSRTAKDLEELRGLAVRLGLDPGVLNLPEPLVAESDFPVANPTKEEMWRGDRSERGRPYWNAIFKKLDPTDADDMRTAQRRVRAGEAPWGTDELFREAFARAGAGQEDAVVLAISQLPDFETYSLRGLVECIPIATLSRLAVKSTIKRVALQVCRANPAKVYLSAQYQTVDLERLAGVVTRAEIVDAVLAGFADGVGLYSADGLFQLARFAAEKLTPDEADEGLRYGLGLLDPLLTDEDGDGQWREALHPPAELRSALAGYLWTGLGSPTGTLRWAHAHAVRALAELGVVETLAPLLDLARQGGAGPYADQRLPFYALHARQWLLLGLNRAAVDGCTPLSAETVGLARAWLETDHVLIRGLAAELILTHGRSGRVVLEPTEQRWLEAINAPASAPVAVSRSDYDADGDKTDALKETYAFGLDAGRYMFSPLGRCFGASTARVEHMATLQVERVFGVAGRDDVRDDPRHNRGIFESMETYAGQGMTPASEGLRDYYGYHGLMLTAGELLRTRPTRLDPYAEPGAPDEFSQWLEREGLTRADGRWVSDRRDPVRLPPLPAPESYDDHTWRWGISRRRLDAIVRLDEPDLCVWGSWTSGDENRQEQVTLRSAFVSRAGGPSLLRSMQLSGEFNVYSLPSAGDDEIGRGALRLKGWIREPSPEKGLDERDGWVGGSLGWPGPRPGDDLVAALGLTADAEGRVWRDSCGEMFRAESWTWTSRRGREHENHPGDRLTVDRGRLADLLEARGEDLILAVSLRRSVERATYAKDRNDGVIEFPWPYFRIYLVSPDGIRTL
ncbi:NACHT domain-containing protein [uncultured Brevundimonas sp.]|uniref:NACHT domain-containing protein n=1 Tax=uncultured Brevundimonas sp. TaxID=213418 RepID=UPI0025FEE987|nr:NACHT domain-containing protein [uncultured Brevundimonas sp.]